MLRDVGQVSRVEMERDDKDTSARNNSLILAIMFWILLALSQVLLWFVVLPLVVVWLNDDVNKSGLEVPWKGGSKTFNWHPILAVTGMIVLSGEGTLVFRALSRVGVSSKDAQKVVHGLLMTLGFLMLIISLAAVFYYHEKQGYGNLESLHSKLGLAVAIHYAVQFVLGLVFYAFPCMPKQARRFLMPYHRFAGKAILVLATLAIVTGIQEQLGWETTKPYSTDMLTGQSLGFVIAYTVMIIVFLLGRDEYRRYQAPKSVSKAVSKEMSQKSLLEYNE